VRDDDNDGDDDDDDYVWSRVISDVSYRRVIVSDIYRVVADKDEIDQILVFSLSHEGFGDKLPSVGFEPMENLGESRQMTSLSQTDEVDETTDSQDHCDAVTSCPVTSDIVPSPARDRRQLDVVPKEIYEPMEVLDPGVPCLSIGFANCDDVDDLLSTHPSAETCGYANHHLSRIRSRRLRPCMITDVRTIRKPVIRSRTIDSFHKGDVVYAI